jgi:phosphoribosylformylglycinamidine cyclo-ligase
VKISYKTSGVDIDKANDFVHQIKPLAKKTFTKSVLSGIGNFGAFFEPNFKKFTNPVFVSSVDGVGTKIKIASALNKFDTVGEDLVNHCVNDIAVCGAIPLFFLDYYATGKLDNSNAFDIVKGLSRGCINNDMSLIGGETAEMPGLYEKNDFDLAGAIVGIVDKKNILKSGNVKRDDVLVGIESNGLHTNGYSLIRKIFDSKKKLNTFYKEFGNTLGEELLKVHKSYLKIIQSSLKNFKIKSISHITGGGIIGNTKRVVPKDRILEVNWSSWKRPFIFELIKNKGGVSETDMRRTFNLGIGLIIIVSKNESDKLVKFLYDAHKVKSYNIGNVR